MWATCSYAVRMAKMIQLRHVPDDLHRKLKARAALEGLSLSEYLLKEVQRAAERPTLAELRQRLARGPPALTRLQASAPRSGACRPSNTSPTCRSAATPTPCSSPGSGSSAITSRP